MTTENWEMASSVAYLPNIRSNLDSKSLFYFKVAMVITWGAFKSTLQFQVNVIDSFITYWALKQKQQKHIHHRTCKSECLFLTLAGGKNITFRGPRCKVKLQTSCAQKPYSSFGCHETLISWFGGGLISDLGFVNTICIFLVRNGKMHSNKDPFYLLNLCVP